LLSTSFLLQRAAEKKIKRESDFLIFHECKYYDFSFLFHNPIINSPGDCCINYNNNNILCAYKKQCQTSPFLNDLAVYMSANLWGRRIFEPSVTLKSVFNVLWSKDLLQLQYINPFPQMLETKCEVWISVNPNSCTLFKIRPRLNQLGKKIVENQTQFAQV
jgi:hypothetical protein